MSKFSVATFHFTTAAALLMIPSAAAAFGINPPMGVEAFILSAAMLNVTAATLALVEWVAEWWR